MMAIKSYRILFMLLMLLSEATGFVPIISTSSPPPMSMILLKMQTQDMTLPSTSDLAVSSRRDLIVNSALVLSSLSAIPYTAFAAASSTPIGSISDRPIAIIGGGGRGGKEIAKALASEGMYAMIITRTGKQVQLPEYAKEYVQLYPDAVDVRNADGLLLKAMQSIHPSAIVYAASASSKGGTAFEVDDEGVGNSAAAAKALDVRFVLISALGIDRPDSKGYQMTNSLGGNYDKIMDAKRHGEEKTKDLLSKSKNYVIVRPGPLLGNKSKNGAADIELNQGDYMGGGISRDELAGVVVGALQSDKKGVTVEAYRTKTRQKIQPEFDDMAGYNSAAGYKELFDNVKLD